MWLAHGASAPNGARLRVWREVHRDGDEEGHERSAMKEVILRLLRDNPAIFYCRICISKLVGITHEEVRNLLPSFAVTHPNVQAMLGACAECQELLTVFRL